MIEIQEFPGGRFWPSGLAVAVASAFVLGGCGSSDSSSSTTTPTPPAPPAAIKVTDASTRCAQLSNTTVPASAIGLPSQGAKVTSIEVVTANSTTGEPEYCKVLGDILAAAAADPSIRFEVNLPSTWNVKALQYGGGGFNGTLITGLAVVANAPAGNTPITKGYVTFGGDSGHQTPGGTFFTNDQAAANYGNESVKRTHDAALALVKTYYKVDPWKVYYQGSSKGGQEGLNAAQRYGNDYDGVIAYYPAQQNQSLVLSWYRIWQAAYRSPGGYLNPAKQALLKSKVLAACDALDGATDGLVANTSACLHTFSVGALRCAGGADTGDTCLSDAQIKTLQTAASQMDFAFPMANGITSAGPYPIYQAGDVGVFLDATGVGTATSYYGFFDGTIKYFFYKDANASSDGFDYTTWRPRVEEMSRIFDSSNPNIDTFKARGGKLLMVQGTTDMLVPPTMTIAYYNQVAARYGASTGGFIKFYVVPGFGHGGGDFLSKWDSLSALEAWAERDTVPANQTTTDGATATAGRTRPLCEYPTWPKYKGSGDLNSAANFTCVSG